MVLLFVSLVLLGVEEANRVVRLTCEEALFCIKCE